MSDQMIVAFALIAMLYFLVWLIIVTVPGSSDIRATVITNTAHLEALIKRLRERLEIEEEARKITSGQLNALLANIRKLSHPNPQ